MLSKTISLMFGIACLGGALAVGSRPAKNIVGSMATYKQWHKVTKEPVLITPQANALCRPALLPAGPHVGAYIEVRVNDAGYKFFVKGATLPIGSIVVKEKEPQSGSAPTLLTVMEKVSNSGKIDDWHFYTFSGDGKKQLDTGSPACRKCHETAGKDFLFRDY